MKKSISIAASILNWVVLVAMLAVVVLHLTPYWQYTSEDILEKDPAKRFSERTASIQDYVWRSFDHIDLEDEFTDILKSEGIITRNLEQPWRNNKFWINDYVAAPIVAFMGAIASIGMCIFFRKTLVTSILPVISGIGGIITFTSNPLVTNKAILAELGADSFMSPSLGLIASVVTLVLGVIFLALCATKFVMALLEKKKQAAA